MLRLFNYWLKCVIALTFLGFAVFGFIDPDSPVSSDNGGGGKGIMEGVQGRVITSDGNPIMGALIQPKSLDEPGNPIPEIAVLTDENGHYRWRLFPGNYMISVSADGYQSASRQVTVKPGQIVTLNFTLERVP